MPRSRRLPLLSQSQPPRAITPSRSSAAQAALDAATSGTGIDLNALEAAKVTAASELATAQAALDAATTADATAQANLQAAQTTVTAAQEKANAAKAAVASAQSAYDAANREYKDAASKRDAAKTAYEQAQQTEADKKAEYDRLVEVRQQKSNEFDQARAEVTDAHNAYDAANAEVEKLNQQIVDLKSNMTVDQNVISRGMFGFMNYIIGGSQFTATQKKNAQDAVSMLTGADDKAEWYDQYVDHDMSRDTNPLSLEQMRNALTYLDTQNNLRKANGQSALSVSLRMTVAAALNTSYSSNIWGHSGCYYDNGENLAGGGGAYTGGETEDTLGWPYTGLYTREKEAFDKYVAQYGDELGSHRYDAYYISQNYNSIYQECGHYLNIIDAAAEAIGIATGSGKNTDSEVTIFDYSADDTRADFTVSEFKKLLNDYIDSAYNAGGTQEQKEQLKQLQNKLAEAQKNFGTAGTAYSDALDKQESARDAYTAADTNVNTAKGEYEKAKSGTAAAKTAYDAAKDALGGIDIESLKQNLDAAKSEAATARAALDKANATLADSKTKAAEAAARKAKARSARDAAKAKSEQANEAYDNATASVKDLAAKRDAAEADLANKQGSLDEAKKADDAARAGEDKARAADVRAATALSDAKQAVAAKKQAVSDAQAKVKAAEGELATANKAFERFAGAQKRSTTPRSPMTPLSPASPMPRSSSRPPTKPSSMRTSRSSRPRPSLPATRHSRPILRLSTTRPLLSRARRVTRSWSS